MNNVNKIETDSWIDRQLSEGRRFAGLGEKGDGGKQNQRQKKKKKDTDISMVIISGKGGWGD